MNTYYVLDAGSNTWSRKHVPLREILSMPGITDSHLLADARTQQTLTVAEACAACRKPRLKTPDAGSLLRWNKPTMSAASPAHRPSSGHGGERSAGAAADKKPGCRREYMVLDRCNQCFSGRVDAAALEHALNAYARQGWKVLSCHPGGIHTAPGGSWEELLIIMERGI